MDDPRKQAMAFDAWMATDPLHDPDAPPGPTYMPQYRLAEQAKAEALAREAVAAAEAGNHAAVVGDDYIRITVFLAAVLFLVGIGSIFKLHTVRYSLIGVGSLLLILAIVLILQQPGLRADRHLGRRLVRANLVAALRRRAPNTRLEPSG